MNPVDQANQADDEKKFENFLGNLLRAGVLLAAAIVVFGGALYLIRHGAEQPTDRVFHGEPADLRKLTGIMEEVVHLKSLGVIQLGLMVLVATPVARVGFSAIGFLQERDFVYVGFTLTVLAVLIYSLFLG